MNRHAKIFLDITPICSHASNVVFISILEGVERRTGAMLHCWNCCIVESNNNSYPWKNIECLPKSLHIFLDDLFVGKEKSIVQAIMQ